MAYRTADPYDMSYSEMYTTESWRPEVPELAKQRWCIDPGPLFGFCKESPTVPLPGLGFLPHFFGMLIVHDS